MLLLVTLKTFAEIQLYACLYLIPLHATTTLQLNGINTSVEDPEIAVCNH